MELALCSEIHIYTAHTYTYVYISLTLYWLMKYQQSPSYPSVGRPPLRISEPGQIEHTRSVFIFARAERTHRRKGKDRKRKSECASVARKLRKDSGLVHVTNSSLLLSEVTGHKVMILVIPRNSIRSCIRVLFAPPPPSLSLAFPYIHSFPSVFPCHRSRAIPSVALCLSRNCSDIFTAFAVSSTMLSREDCSILIIKHKHYRKSLIHPCVSWMITISQ